MKPCSPQIGILHYCAGNIGSVQRACDRLKIKTRNVDTEDDIQTVDGLIVPGAGSASAAMRSIRKQGLTDALRTYEKPFLGICLGMQLLFDYSEEGGTQCLGIIPGKVQKLRRIHIGWNMLRPFDPTQGRQDQHDASNEYAYFVHGYACFPDDSSLVTMTTQFDRSIVAGIRRKNFFGVQWHPEKSGDIGDRFLLSFSRLCK